MLKRVLRILLVLLPATVSAAPAASTTVDGASVGRMARDWLVERFAGEVEPAGIELSATPRDLALPAGEAAFQLSMQSGSIGAGAVTVLVEAVVNDPRGTRTTRSTTAHFRINAAADVLVAVRDLPRRAVIAAGDVRVERRPATRLPQNAVRDLADAVGKETTRPVAPGEVLSASALSAPLVVRRGAVVSLVLEGPNFKIVARGVAAEDGAVGAPIRVINQSSRREITGRVEDERTVRVSF